MNRRDARQLARYNAWANILIFEAVAGLPEGEAVKPRPPTTDLPGFLRDAPPQLD